MPWQDRVVVCGAWRYLNLRKGGKPLVDEVDILAGTLNFILRVGDPVFLCLPRSDDGFKHIGVQRSRSSRSQESRRRLLLRKANRGRRESSSSHEAEVFFLRLETGLVWLVAVLLSRAGVV